MIKKPHKIKIKKPSKVHFTEPKPIFSNKEIIFRSGGRAKVFNISSKLQVFVLMWMLSIGIWSAYSYYLYNVSDEIISTKDKELDEARDALVDLMTDFVAVHRNVSSMFSEVNEEQLKDETELNRYKQQASVVEEKIRQITDNEDWVESKDIEKQVTVREALLQRDRALSERNELVNKISALEENVKKLEDSEIEILNQVEKISTKEMEKIKEALSEINKSMKNQNKYFNPLANSKKDSTGGKFEADIPSVENEELSKKMQEVFSLINDVAYYKEVMKSVPVGKPVWSYWLSSPFGKRSDPFNKKSAAHKGVDLASNKGNKIKTMAKGKVVRSEWNGGYGNYVEIDHGNGFKTKYAHLNKSYVEKGQYVEQGESIGEVGSSGRSTGPHLHYEVLFNGTPVDPMTFIKVQI
ncbi:MAG: peptidoglycan DD-metalloendopeptidase family protein [Alphaproteobacteria bacterium]|nr:peptidoglycan DD-metalloendopeptidase family protein [Alphaproteobacteria bacterium]